MPSTSFSFPPSLPPPLSPLSPLPLPLSLPPSFPPYLLPALPLYPHSSYFSLFSSLPPTSLPPPPGTYLLSGGEECVLVVWQLASCKSHYRPRLGAQITRIACAPSDQSFAVSLQNNGKSKVTILLFHTMEVNSFVM